MKLKLWLRLVGVLQIAGSGIGIALLVLATGSDDSLAASIAFGVLFVAALVAGIGLWRSVPHRQALVASGLFWLAQVPHLATTSFVYRLWTGPACEIFVKGSGESLNRGIFYAFGFSFDFDFAVRPERPFVFGINLFAIAVLLLLWRASRAAKPAIAHSEVSNDDRSHVPRA
ncbi:hypothetical protein [Tahibacter soli]|uniref:Uncharacterized protein n=1 Tax=Tahibacter soli TaxID=2983605 RepID=A0A9X3YMJ9_9GAMM|nr:hypothetical protein [Tahibacter soli]MDC8015156.1 hypothetical protein [Tahibacter soli]